MRRPARVALLLSTIAALAALGPASAQTPPPPTDQSTPAPTTPPAPKRDRAVSDSLAASLAASMPKYNPPPKPRPEDEDVDLRDVDKPRNGIIRLPKYVVREKKPPVFRERDLYTNKGLSDLARRRYLTPGYMALNAYHLPIPFFASSESPEQLALDMYAEDERLNNISDLHDTAQTLGRGGDDAASTYIKRVTDETYIRGFDFGHDSGPQALTTGSRY